MTGLVHVLAVLASTFTYSLPTTGAAPQDQDFTAPRLPPQPANDNSRPWPRPIFPEDERSACEPVFERHVARFGVVRVGFGCTMQTRD